MENKEQLKLTIDEAVKYNQLKYAEGIEFDWFYLPKVFLGVLAFFALLKYLINFDIGTIAILNLLVAFGKLWIVYMLVIFVFAIITDLILKKRHNRRLIEKIISERSVRRSKNGRYNC